MPSPTWVTPHDWISSSPLSSDRFQRVADDLTYLYGVWTAYTPTVTQGVTVTKTVTYSKYRKIGLAVKFQALLAITGAGTASEPIVISLPFTPAQAGNMEIGGAYWYNGSVNIPAKALSGASGLVFIPTATDQGPFLGDGAAPYGSALANGHSFSLNVEYESTT